MVSIASHARFPPGSIVMWSGSVASIPIGWVLCNGSNGTPDLRDKFVVGAGSTYDPEDTGGAATVTLTEDDIPTHDHDLPATIVTSAGGIDDDYNVSSGFTTLVKSVITGSVGPVQTRNFGDGNSHENLPPYFSLAYIMKE